MLGWLNKCLYEFCVALFCVYNKMINKCVINSFRYIIMDFSIKMFHKPNSLRLRFFSKVVNLSNRCRVLLAIPQNIIYYHQQALICPCQFSKLLTEISSLFLSFVLFFFVDILPKKKIKSIWQFVIYISFKFYGYKH